MQFSEFPFHKSILKAVAEERSQSQKCNVNESVLSVR